MNSPEPVAPPKRPGRIITFYSYKGGTGRSMAMANVAWILASAGRRVLVIDWDLEAPGLHRYYHPFLADPDMTNSEGLIDFLLEFAIAARQPATSADAKWYEEYANLLLYAVPVDWPFAPGGALHLVPAGKQDSGYGLRVSGFDWQSFYTQLGGGVLLEAMKERLRAEYDYVLIDSRTGLSDTSGVCSVQLPDDLVCCFTLNSQSIQGVGAVADSAFEQRRKPSGEPGLRVWPVSTRVELHERDRLENAREIARTRFRRFLSHLPRNRRSYYMQSVEVLYQPYFAYEEVLATIADRRQQTGSLLASFEQICGWITDGDVTQLGEMPEDKRQEALALFTRKPPGKVRVYLPVRISVEQVERLSGFYSLMPDWYVKSIRIVTTNLPDWLSLEGFTRLRESRQFVELLIKNYGAGNVMTRADFAPLLSKVLGLTITSGTVAEADAVLLLDEPDERVMAELEFAAKNSVPVFPVQLPSAKAARWKIPGGARSGVFRFYEDDFEGSFAELLKAIEHAARQENSPTAGNPDDPQKGRWGQSAQRNGRTFTASVEDLGNSWFEINLQVYGTGLEGEVAFHLHPTFTPSVITVTASQGTAQLKLQAWGAFTVGAIADEGRTFLELDLASLPDAPTVFRER